MEIKCCKRGHYYNAELGGCPVCKDLDAWIPELPQRFRELGILKKIGRCSVGEVYRIQGEKDYALKVIRCGQDGVKYRNALYECSIMEAAGSVPQVVSLVDAETDAETKTVYLLEEYCQPFMEYWQRNGASEIHKLLWVMELCAGLAALKKLGIYHLDIQPKNLFVAGKRRIRLGDFSSALWKKDLPYNRDRRGTPQYRAPEVYRDRRCSEQSEIYSLGQVLFLLFSNQPPLSPEDPFFDGPMLGVLCEDAALGAQLNQVISRCCAYLPQDRIQTFEELEAALRELLWDADTELTFPWTKQESPLWPVPLGKTAETSPMEYAAGRWDDSGPLAFEADSAASSCTLPFNADSMAATCAKAFAADDFGTTETLVHDSSAWGPPTATAGYSEEAFSMACPMPAPTAMTAPEPREKAAAPEKKGLFQRLRDLSGGKKEKRKQPDCTAVPLRKVQFSALAPEVLEKGRYGLVDLYMYEEAFRKVVDQALEKSKAPLQEKKSGTALVADNARIRVNLEASGLDIEDGEQTQIWQGEYLLFSFSMLVPRDYPGEEILLRATVYINDVIATKLNLVAQCQGKQKQSLSVQRQDVLSAFVSYASEDRGRVAAIVQGMQKARPDLDIFFDVESLRSGEDWERALYREIQNRDMLYLCWSQYARRSQWVEAEWRYALDHKGIDCIEPIPIDPPRKCPPPLELQKKHFHDKLLYVIEAEQESPWQ